MGHRVWPKVLTSHLLTHNKLLLFSLLPFFPSFFFSSPSSCLPFSGPISSQKKNSASYFSLLVPLLIPLYPNMVFLTLLPRSSQPYLVLLKWFPRPCHLNSPGVPSAPLQVSVRSGCFLHNSPLNTCKIYLSPQVISTTSVTFSPCKLLHPAVSHGLFI